MSERFVSVVSAKTAIYKYSSFPFPLYYSAPKSQLGWLNLPAALAYITTASDGWTPSGQVPADVPQQGTDGYGGGEILRTGRF